MWATSPHLEQAIELGKAWGFEYRTVAFIWDKMSHNPGQYTLSNCELCLVFKRGRIPKQRGARNVQQLVRSPRGKHSEKPIEVLQGIEKMFPSQSKIELFARNKPKGWSVWGLMYGKNMDNGNNYLLDKSYSSSQITPPFQLLVSAGNPAVLGLTFNCCFSPK
jgi:N6-adenosine-specific RNA methylase IME4